MLQYNWNITPTLDVATFNAIINQLKASMGQFGKDIKPIDEKAFAASLANVQSSVQKTGQEFDKLGTKGQEAGAKAGKGINDGVTKEVSKTADVVKDMFKNMLSFAGGGALLGGVQGVLGGIEGLLEAGKKSYEMSERMELGFKQAGLAGEGLEAQLDRTGQFAKQMGNDFAISGMRIRELSAYAASVGGATGKANEDITKLAIGVEKASQGMISGEMAIKTFTRGLNDPEGMANLGRLKTQFPQLATALKGVTDPAELTQKALLALGPTFATLEEQAKGPLGSMTRFENSFEALKTTVGRGIVDALSPVVTFVGENLVPALQGITGSIGPAIKDTVNTLKPMAPLFVAAGVAVGTYTIYTNISTIATTALGTGMNTLRGILLNHPLMLYAGIVAGLAVGIHQLTKNIGNEAEANLNAAEADKARFETKIKTNEANQKAIQSNIDLISNYESLANKALQLGGIEKLSKADREQLTQTTISLNKEYPGLIKSNADLSGNLELLAGKASLSKESLKNLGTELSSLQNNLQATNLRILAAQADVAGREFEKTMANAIKGEGIGKAISSATEFLFGTSTAQKNAIQFVKTWKDAAYKVNTELEKNNLLDKMSGEFSKVKGMDPGTYTSLVQSYSSFLDSIIAKKNGNVKKDEKLNNDTNNNIVKSEETKTIKIKSIADELAKYQIETNKIRNDANRKATEDEIEREKKAVTDRVKNDIEKENEWLKEKQKREDISGAEKADAALKADDRIKAITEKGNADRLAIDVKFAKKSIEDKQKEADELAKKEIETQKLHLEMLQTEEKMQSGAGLISNIQKQSVIRIDILKKENQQKIQEYLKDNVEYKKAQDELVNIQAQRAAGIVTPLSVEAAQANLNKIKAKILDTSEFVVLTNKDTVNKTNQELVNSQYAQAIARINQVTDLNERERQLTLAEALKTYNDEYDAAQGNYSLELQALRKFHAAKLTAEEAYWTKSSALASAALAWRDAMMNLHLEIQDDSEAKQQAKELKDKQKSMDAERKLLDMQLHAGEISTREYYEKIGKLNDDYNKNAEDLATAEKKAKSKVWDQINKASAKAFEEQASIQFKSFRELTKGIGDFSNITKQSWTDLSNAWALTGAQMIMEGKSVAKAMVLSILAAAKAMIPILVTMILGKEFVEKSLLGFATAAVMSGALYVALSVAEAAASSAQFAKGGLVPGSRQYIQVNEEGQEFVSNARVTAKNLTDYAMMNQYDLSLYEHIKRNRPDITKGIINDYANSNSWQNPDYYHIDHKQLKSEQRFLVDNDVVQTLLIERNMMNKKFDVLIAKITSLEELTKIQNIEIKSANKKKTQYKNPVLKADVKIDTKKMHVQLQAEKYFKLATK